VRLGTAGIGLQGFIEPGESFIGAATMGRLHRLVETIPIPVLVVLHELRRRASDASLLRRSDPIDARHHSRSRDHAVSDSGQRARSNRPQSQEFLVTLTALAAPEVARTAGGGPDWNPLGHPWFHHH